MSRLRDLTLLVLAVMPCRLVAQQTGAARNAPRVVDDTLIQLRDGRRWAPGLFQMRYHGRLEMQGGSYLVISGFECQDCDAPRLIHVAPFGAALGDTTYPAFYFPGTVGSEDQPEGFIRSRAFLGVCGATAEPLLVITESRLGDQGHWSDSTRVVSLLGGTIRVRTVPGRAVTERIALQQVRKGQCSEIPPAPHQLEG